MSSLDELLRKLQTLQRKTSEDGEDQSSSNMMDTLKSTGMKGLDYIDRPAASLRDATVAALSGDDVLDAAKQGLAKSSFESKQGYDVADALAKRLGLEFTGDSSSDQLKALGLGAVATGADVLLDPLSFIPGKKATTPMMRAAKGVVREVPGMSRTARSAAKVGDVLVEGGTARAEAVRQLADKPEMLAKIKASRPDLAGSIEKIEKGIKPSSVVQAGEMPQPELREALANQKVSLKREIPQLSKEEAASGLDYVGPSQLNRDTKRALGIDIMDVDKKSALDDITRQDMKLDILKKMSGN